MGSILNFNEAKATQAAAFLLKRLNGRVKYLMLIKLLYLADRKALITWGRTITTDRHVSMNNGPVVSRIYSLICEEPSPDEGKTFWHTHIQSVGNWDVQLACDPSDDELSQAEESLLEEILAEHGHKDRWQLVEETHALPEWKHPSGTSLPIEVGDILRAAHKSEAEIAEVESELRSLSLIESYSA